MNEITELYPKNKNEMYSLLCQQLKAITEGETHLIPNLANASALLNGALNDINWVGFYLMTDGCLLLGPFQGKTACIRIPVGQGVCGSTALKGYTHLVENVHEFPGHIACDSASNSEIVVPIRNNDTIVGVLDIDSPLYSRFDENDQRGLEAFVSILENVCDWTSLR